jgi:hypothetical protein
MLFLFTALFTILSLTCYSQKDHEFKADMLDFLSLEYKVTYEQVFSNLWGVEFGLALDTRTQNVSEVGSFGIINHEYSSVFVRTDLAFKYYFLFNKYRGNGLYVGPYFRAGSSLYVQDGYIEKWEEVNGRPASERMLVTRAVKSIDFGLICGYKFLIKEKFIIEPGFTYTLDREVGKGALDGSSAHFDFTFKTGYRF